MDLSEFIRTARLPQSESIDHPDWDFLYVRRSKLYIKEQFIEVFVLANIKAKEPGKGSFKRLLNELPYHLVIENAHNPRFKQYLIKNNWIVIGDGFSYYKDQTQNICG